MSQKLLKSLSTSVLDPQIRHRSANSTVHAMVAPIVQLQRSSVNSGLVATVRIGKLIAIRSGTIRIPVPFAVTLETNKSASSAPCVKFMSGVLPGLYPRRRGLQLLQAH